MRQVLHLLIVDAEHRSALAAPFAGRWLLPILTCGERVRGDRHALRWATGRGLDVEVVGQWLGRVGTAATDWLMILSTTGPSNRKDPQLSWTPLGDLTPAAAVVDYQGWAVTRSLETGPLPSVSGPFGRIGWNAEVKAWIERVNSGSCGCSVPYRTGPHEVVLGAQGVSGPVFFKGLSSEGGGEARLTRLLSGLEPSFFARTIALEERADGTVWWLTAGCSGRPAFEGHVVGRALARVQRRVMSSPAVLRELHALDVAGAFEWAERLVAADSGRGVLQACHETVTSAGVPRSWIPLDLDPVNVLAADSGEVRFIDLDDSFFGPAPLAMALFARRSGDRSAYGVYEQSWRPIVTGLDWPGFETAVAVLDAWLGWRRVECHTQRGDLHGALAFAEARIRERLERILHRR